MTRNRRFDLIVFDWDGTLFDSTALITRCIQSAAADLGLPVPSDEAASHVIGLGLTEALQHAVPSLPASRYPELGQRYRHHYVTRQHELVLFPGTLAMLHALKARNHWLGVATGKSRRGLDEALREAGVAQRFRATRCADEGFRSRIRTCSCTFSTRRAPRPSPR
jgi:phosphoglycolate phosphatase